MYYDDETTKKLHNVLPDNDKAFLDGIEWIYNDLVNLKENVKFRIEEEDDIKAFTKIKIQIWEDLFPIIEHWVEGHYRDLELSMIENNHYSVDENGNVVDEDDYK